MSDITQEILTQNGFLREHIFSVTPIEESFFSRPEGDNLTLAGSEQLLSQVLGINPRVNDSIESLTELSLASRNLNFKTNQVGCYYNDGLKIDKKICQWCTRNIDCTSHENNSRLRSLNFEILSKSKCNNNDAKILQDYFSNKKFSRTDGIIFTDEIDPFKPGLTIEGNRTLSIIKLDDINYSKSQTRNSWSHVFFSRCLGRSVTVFEAIILNSSIGILKGEFGNLYETNSSTVNLPKISDIKSLFYKLSGNQELNMTKIQLKSSLKQHKLIGDEINSLGSDFTLLKNLYNNTKKYVEHNFFDINQEILFNYNLEIDFEENVVNFFHEVQFGLHLKISNTISLENRFFDVRRKAYLISNQQNSSKSLPDSLQFVRHVIIDKLENAYVLVDGIDSQLSFNGKKSGLHIPSNWLDVSYEPSEYFIQRVAKGQRSQEVRLWNGISRVRVKGKNILYLFSPADIFSALAVNLYSKSKNYSISDPNDATTRDDFFKLLYDIFFDKIEYNSSNTRYNFKSSSRGKLETFREIYTQPILRRFMPYELLYSLIKYKVVTENFVKIFTEYDPRDDRLSTENIVFTSPGFQFQGVSHDEMVLLFQREHKTFYFDEVIRTESSQWKLCHASGWRFDINHEKRINKIVDLLNYDYNSSAKSSFAKNQFFLPSIKVFDALNDDVEIAYSMWTYFMERLNQEGTRGLIVLVFSDEYEFYEDIIGGSYKTKTGIFHKGAELYLLEPKENLSNGSPNFLPLKIV